MLYNQPFDQPSNPNAGYVNGNPSTGTQGSIPPASAIEYPQREVVDTINFANVNLLTDFTNTLCAAPANTDLTQLRKAIEGIARYAARFLTGGPVFLTASSDYYVNASTGNDGNDGTTATVTGGHGPFATLVRVLVEISKFNLNGFNINVHVADGTYGGISLPLVSGSGRVTFTGDTAAPINCAIAGVNQSAILGNSCGPAYVFNGFTLQTSGTLPGNGDSVSGIQISGLSNVVLSNINWGNCYGNHCTVVQGAALQIGGVLTIGGGCTGNAQVLGAHMWSDGGLIFSSSILPPSMTITAAVTFPGGFVYCQNLGQNIGMVYTSITGAGNVTGKKFTVKGISIINTGGQSTSYYPGTISGTQSDVSQYL